MCGGRGAWSEGGVGRAGLLAMVKGVVSDMPYVRFLRVRDYLSTGGKMFALRRYPLVSMAVAGSSLYNMDDNLSLPLSASRLSFVLSSSLPLSRSVSLSLSPSLSPPPSSVTRRSCCCRQTIPGRLLAPWTTAWCSSSSSSGETPKTSVPYRYC